MNTADEIQPISRALDVLAVLNRRSTTSLKILHAETGLPKPSLIRLLAALGAAGYVEKSSGRAGYRVTARVLDLSAGFSERERIVEVAGPLMRAFTAQHRWPVTLATLGGSRMRLQFTTARDSPLSPDRAAASFPVLDSALGRAYVAFCPGDERKLILQTLAGFDDPSLGTAREPGALEKLYGTIRRNGYAATGPIPGDRGLGIAVPIVQKRRVLAAITMRVYRSSMSEADAVRRYLPDLRALAGQISRALST